ncbi:type II toxin-antitoxin system RelE/ParE family toxin [Niveispirillum irakense]|uniref:type II toxin-antitoxin system RelE/ParE family toxin n=1 Tax=Niveispirillum irakense TaxID=34011 RepID=UPI0006862F79|nr:type II toxin-antitoxin system RelE/ParE family toxin [Niveispirillum irakense]
MTTIKQTELYAKWFRNLRDQEAQSRIVMRIRRLAGGNAGDAKALRGGISELRIDYGPGYRVYFTRHDNGAITILLAGGDKRTQSADIETAIALAATLAQNRKDRP